MLSGCVHDKILSLIFDNITFQMCSLSKISNFYNVALKVIILSYFLRRSGPFTRPSTHSDFTFVFLENWRFDCTLGLARPSPPQDFQWTYMGWVWTISWTTQFKRLLRSTIECILPSADSLNNIGWHCPHLVIDCHLMIMSYTVLDMYCHTMYLCWAE